MADPQVLCPALYSKLKRAFGEVVVANNLERLHADNLSRPDGSRVLRVHSGGEYYRTNCPFCGDGRFRLWFSYRWAEFPWLAHCYNEECVKGIEGVPRRIRLQEWILNSTKPIKLHIIEGIAHPDDGPIQPVALPGDIELIDAIGEDVAANYLQQRGFDLKELSQVYGVGVCRTVDDSRYWAMRGRIFIPIIQHGDVVGWQGRYPADLDWRTEGIPKYYNLPHMPRRKLLYNYDTARLSPVVVITEGVADTWSLGPCAISLFGCSLSNYHRETIAATWAGKGKTVVVMLDGEALENNLAMTEELTRSMLASGANVLSVELPEGTDPGSLAREVCWDFIEAAADEAGIKLNLPSWYLRSR